jgi:predicted  nucleic acid-binding Zn-ribbon protein
VLFNCTECGNIICTEEELEVCTFCGAFSRKYRQNSNFTAEDDTAMRAAIERKEA